MLDDLEFLLYQRMCHQCPNARKCHDDCDYCDEFLQSLDALSNVEVNGDETR